VITVVYTMMIHICIVGLKGKLAIFPLKFIGRLEVIYFIIQDQAYKLRLVFILHWVIWQCCYLEYWVIHEGRAHIESLDKLH
jgi:hypothetical protein